MKRFSLEDTTIEDLKVVSRQPIQDERGFFERLYDSDELGEAIGSRRIVQVNRTRTLARASVRGMHYQVPPSAEMKLVMCIRGSVFDVAVDLREGSPTFLSWHAEVIEEAGQRMVLIPEGFAHGFQTLEDDSELVYFHTAAHDLATERTVNPRDPALAITWPEEISQLSARDGSAPMLGTDFTGVAL